MISSEEYNPVVLYSKLVNNPSVALEVIQEIQLRVYNKEMNLKAQEIFRDLLTNLKKSLIEEFAIGSASSLYAYFGYGLTAKTAAQVGLSKILGNFLGDSIPLSLAHVVLQSYIMPMARSIHAAWEDQGYIGETYLNMYHVAYQIAHPENNVFNLTNSDVFASLYGTLCLLEFHYCMHTYFYRSHQIGVSETELKGLSQSAETALDHAEVWADFLESINSYSI